MCSARRDQFVLARLERLEVASPAAHDEVPSVAAHVAQQDAVVTGQRRDVVGRHQLGVDVVLAGDVAAAATCLDALALDVHDGRDHVEVEEREGAVRGVVRLLLGVTHVDRLDGLLREEGTGVLVGDVGGRGGLGGHDRTFSASLTWVPLA